MWYARLVITAHDDYWLDAALHEFTGYASSVIACDVECGVERRLSTDETPDGRPGAAVLLFGFSPEALGKSIPKRTGQCLMTCATTAVYDGLPEGEQRLPLGKQLRYFGDGFQKSKLLAGRRYWRVPVMDGEFLVEDKIGAAKGIGGGNLILQATTLPAALAGARRGVAAIAELPGVITPFPGGIARSGSKVGSRYKGIMASTADAYCPTLRGRTDSQLDPGAMCALEIVIDGVSEAAIRQAMQCAMHAIALDDTQADGEIVAITAGNYGGKLGKFHFHLRQLLA